MIPVNKLSKELMSPNEIGLPYTNQSNTPVGTEMTFLMNKTLRENSIDTMTSLHIVINWFASITKPHQFLPNEGKGASAQQD